jgi:predicted transcriptional regulator
MSFNTEAESSSAFPSPLRIISDPQSLRALAHPVRIALIEALTVDGPLTATEAAELVGESPSSCSFHLRQLAKYGFVEEAEARKGRSRPWRITSVGLSFGRNQDNPATRIAAAAVTRLLRERQLERYWHWLESRDVFPAEWRDAAGDSEFTFWLTAAELAALSEELTARLLPLVQERLADSTARPAGALPVELLLFAFPMRAPEAEAVP